jgi:hypothetical protein
MNAAYCGILNENWIVVPIIYFHNFIILGETTMNWKHVESYQQLTKYVIVFPKEIGYFYLSDFIN